MVNTAIPMISAKENDRSIVNQKPKNLTSKLIPVIMFTRMSAFLAKVPLFTILYN